MKRFLYALLFLPTTLFADSISTGSGVNFVIVSTGIVDPAKSHVTKINDNFQKADSFMAILSTTATTATARINQIAIDTGTLAGGKLNAGTNNAGVVVDTMTSGLGNDGSLVQNNPGVIFSSQIAPSHSGQTWDDEATALGGMVTKVNVAGAGASAAQSGSTVTLTIPQGGGRTYDLIIGTPGSPGIDCAYTNTTQFNACLASVSARGLIWSTTAQAMIFSRNGIYQMQDSTIPAGIDIVHGSSSVWAIGTDVNKGIVTIYGNVTGAKYDIGNVAFRGRMVVVSSGGRLSDFEIYGAGQQLSAGTVYSAALYITGNDARVRGGRMRDFKAVDGITMYGDKGNTLIYSASGYVLSDCIWENYASPGSVNSTNFGMFGSSDGVIERCTFDGINQNFMGFTANPRGNSIRHNTFKITNSDGAPDGGLFIWSATGTNGVFSSTANAVDFNTIINNTADASRVFWCNALIAAEQANGTTAQGNRLFNLTSAGVTFANLNTGCQKFQFQNNDTFDGPGGGAITFLTDSGAGTISVGNTRNGVIQ